MANIKEFFDMSPRLNKMMKECQTQYNEEMELVGEDLKRVKRMLKDVDDMKRQLYNKHGQFKDTPQRLRDLMIKKLNEESFQLTIEERKGKEGRKMDLDRFK